MQCEVAVAVQPGQGSQCGMPHSGQGEHRWGRRARVSELLPLRGTPVLSRPTCVGVPLSAVTVTPSTPTHARSVPRPRVRIVAVAGSEQHTVMALASTTGLPLHTSPNPNRRCTEQPATDPCHLATFHTKKFSTARIHGMEELPTSCQPSGYGRYEICIPELIPVALNPRNICLICIIRFTAPMRNEAAWHLYKFVELKVAGPHTMQCCTLHFGAVRPVWSAFSTQCTVNL